MGTQASRFLERNNINAENLLYITRDSRKTMLHIEDGRVVDTFLPIKTIMKELPENSFDCINKGVVVAVGKIQSIVNNVYVMVNGAKFTGRVRAVKNLDATKTVVIPNNSDWDNYKAFDDYSLAFCIIELVFDEHGRGIDFIFRYCNKEMEVLEGKSIKDMLNHSFYEIFENADKKWLITYADVALNGVKRTIESYSPEIDAHLRIYCYQPKPNFCACTLIKL